jgi:hypothetical protein
MKKLLSLGLLIVASIGVRAQSSGTPTQGPGNTAGILWASNFGQWSVPQGNTGEFSWSVPSLCTATANGIPLQPVFDVGTPILIRDQVPANSETVTPSAVTTGGFGCSITVAPVNQHSSFTLESATAGLQEAINYAHGLPYEVILTPDWTRLGGTTGMITSAKGNYNVSIFDQRTSVLVPYVWNGSAYAATSFGGSACNPNTIPNGCTGAITAAAAAVNIINGNPIAPSTVTSSVNSQINVMAPPYNATGNCTTDDYAAILAAESAANATGTGAVLYFPLPPGGCYLTSTLPWYGLSMQGQQPKGVNPPGQGVVIKGQPGEDVFHAPDPTTVTSPAPRPSMSLRDIVFEFDDTVDVSSTIGAHRWPGRWVQDAGMNASSAVFTSPHSVISCGDVGQAIQVNGAGVGGANLVTTIASVSPCGANALGQTPTITLTAAASTTVAAGTGTAYISIAGLSATQTVGNAAIAMDCYDGNTAHYTMAGVPTINQFELTNVKFYGLSNASLNHSAGIFIQGCYAPARLTANNSDLYGAFGAAFVPAQLDSYQSQGLQDYPTWNGGTWEGTYPWISYDGGDGILSGIQVYDSQYGPQIMNSGVYTGDTVTGWTINVPETEGETTPNYGWRLEGSGFHLTNAYLGGARGGTVGPIWDAVDSTCANCGWLGTPQINGSRNHIDFTGELQTQQPIDNGIGNQITYRGFNPSGASASRSSNLTQTIFDQPVGSRTADSFRNGNAGMYPSDSDLVFGPVDFFNSGITDVAAEISADSTAFFGKAFAIKNATPYVFSFYSMWGVNYAGNGEAVIGTEVPPTKAQVIFGFKCAASTSITLTAYLIASYTVIGTDTPTCHTGWTTDAIPVDFTSYSGQGFGFGVTSSSNDAQIEFVAIRPYQHDYNGYTPAATGTCTGGQFETGDTITGPTCSAPTVSAFSGGLGTSYQDVTETAAPSNPASGNDRLYTDISTHQLTCRTSSGGNCGLPAGVSSINSTTGPFTFSFSAGAGSCTGTTCTFTGLGTGGGSVTNFIAGTWPAWLTPSVATSTTTPTLSVAATTGLTQNEFLATSSGSSGPVGLRTIVNADIPTTLTGITIDGVTPTTLGYVDPTSSIQTQLNVKQNALTNPVTGPGSGATIGHMAVMGNTSGTSITDGGAIPSVGTWGALNYPTWVSGAPFVKMTAAGTFALDTNTYLTSSGVSGMTSGQIPVAASGTTITSSKVLAGSGSGITTGPTSSTNLDCANFSGTGGQIADSGSPCGSGSSGLSGMTAGQIPVAATASTVTSSKALAGSGSAIPTGPATSTSGDAVVYTGTSGQQADAGFAPASAIGCTTVSSLSPANNGCYQLSTSSSVAMPAASAFTIFTVQTESAATATFTGVTLSSDAGCSTYLSGSTLALTGNHAISVKSDGTNVWASCL